MGIIRYLRKNFGVEEPKAQTTKSNKTIAQFENRIIEGDCGEPYNKGFRKDQLTGSYGDFKTVEVKSNGERYPTDVVYFKTAESEGEVYHPTQKPVELGRYLIRTFTKEGDIVLDNTCGSGSFLVSAVLEGRKFVGIEKNQEVYLFKKHKIDYIKVCKQRIKEAEARYKVQNNKLQLF